MFQQLKKYIFPKQIRIILSCDDRISESGLDGWKEISFLNAATIAALRAGELTDHLLLRLCQTAQQGEIRHHQPITSVKKTLLHAKQHGEIQHPPRLCCRGIQRLIYIHVYSLYTGHIKKSGRYERTDLWVSGKNTISSFCCQNNIFNFLQVNKSRPVNVRGYRDASIVQSWKLAVARKRQSDTTN